MGGGPCAGLGLAPEELAGPGGGGWAGLGEGDCDGPELGLCMGLLCTGEGPGGGGKAGGGLIGAGGGECCSSQHACWSLRDMIWAVPMDSVRMTLLWAMLSCRA